MRRNPYKCRQPNQQLAVELEIAVRRDTCLPQIAQRRRGSQLILGGISVGRPVTLRHCLVSGVVVRKEVSEVWVMSIRMAVRMEGFPVQETPTA